MPPGTQDTGSRATIALREAVRQLPSTMARLAFLSRLRDPDSGVYRHAAATGEAEREDIDRLLRRLHEKAFAEWLNYRLEEQKADLDLYFSALRWGKARAVQAWLQLESYRLLAPALASPKERQLFFADLEALLELMANELALPTGWSGEREERATSKTLVTTKELSAWLGVPIRTLRFWAETGEIPAIKMGRRWRFRREDIRERLRRRPGDE